MALNDITAKAVTDALDEFDQIGRDAFLQRYDVGEAHGYYVLRNDKKYDAKAILAAAHGKLERRQPLHANDFQGGQPATRALQKLGFQVLTPKQAASTSGHLPDPRYTTPTGVHRYDKSKAEEWVKAGKVPPPPDFSAATHDHYRRFLEEVVELARQHDLEGLKRWQKLYPKSSSRIAILEYRDLCIRALEHGAQSAVPAQKGFENDLSEPEQMPTAATRPVNLILYGPPGTGKTYATIGEAVRLCDGGLPEGGAGAVKRRYDALVKAKRIEFVTFHQSYSYEDFVMGLRPEVAEPSGIEGSTSTVGGFSLVPTPGVFYRIAKAARANRGPLQNGEVPKLNKDRNAFKMSLGATWLDEGTSLFRECIDSGYVLLGWGGNVDWSSREYGDLQAIRNRWIKDHPEAKPNDSNIRQLHRLRNLMKVGDLVIISLGNKRFRAIGEVTGPYQYLAAEEHEYFHRRPVRWLWHDDTGLPREQIYNKEFSQVSIYQLDSADIEWEALEQIVTGGGQLGVGTGNPEAYVLIIDEINRADVSKVFGELITLLEPDKRLGMRNALTVTLPYSNEQFDVPANLHVIGTMNTADRSIALLDTALRRRFQFKEIMPNSSLLKPVDGIDIGAALDGINARIEYFFDRDHQVGHAYFMDCVTKTELEAVMRDKVIPLLAEYFYEDWSKVWRALAEPEGDEGAFLKRNKLVAPKGGEESDEDVTRWRYTVRETFADDAFVQLAK